MEDRGKHAVGLDAYGACDIPSPARTADSPPIMQIE
jgi:hypothetical protein